MMLLCTASSLSRLFFIVMFELSCFGFT